MTLSALAQLATANDKPEEGPLSIEAEQALLGTVLFENSAFAGVSHLRPGAFGEQLHGAMWGVIAEKINAGQLAEPIGLMERLKGQPAFDELGGLRYLADLVDRAPPPHTAPTYANIITDTAVRRGLFRFGALLRDFVLATDGAPAGEVLGEVRKAMEELEAETALDDTSMVTGPEIAEVAIKNLEHMAEHGRAKGRMTGLRCVDRRLGGLRPGALIVIGGRPSMGKTALARAILSGAADHNPDANFAFLGIEMGPEEMMQRELSSRTFQDDDCRVRYQDMGRGVLTPMDIAAVKLAARRVPKNLILDDCHGLSLEDVRRKVWALKRRGNLAAIVIDYLQLMRRPRADGRNEASVLGEITQGLKLLARQAGICIVLLSQLSRQVESRDDKRPQLSDLRESGAIEQDADAVLFPYREFYYVSRSEPKDGHEHVEWEMRCADLRTRLDVICAKQRQGAVGTDRQVYEAEFDHIEDWKE